MMWVFCERGSDLLRFLLTATGFEMAPEMTLDARRRAEASLANIVSNEFELN